MGRKDGRIWGDSGSELLDYSFPGPLANEEKIINLKFICTKVNYLKNW
jgi:hypothetical protein